MSTNVSETSVTSPHELNTETKITKSILSPALRAAQALNKIKNIGTTQVELPISKDKIKISALSSLSELEAKTLIGNIRTYNTKNLELFYSCCDFGENPKTFEQFLKYTRADFLTILYGITICTFSQLAEQRYICSNINCSNPNENRSFTAQVKTKDLEIKFGDNEYISHTGNYLNDLTIYSNDYLTISYKFEIMEELLELFESKSNEEIRSNLVNYQMLVPSNELTPIYIHEISIKNGDESIKLTNKNDIFIFLSKLAVTTKEEIEAINKVYIENWRQYTPIIDGRVVCPHCQHVNKVEDIDLMVEFFLKISTIY